MSAYVFPSVFHCNEDDGSYTITFPDLPGCISEGKSLENALYMASSALQSWIECSLEVGQAIPQASGVSDVKVAPGDFVNLVRADVKEKRAVRRTVSIPEWMDDAAAAAHLSLSRVLQDALKERLDAG